MAWFPGPVEDTERYLLRLHRLNQGLDTRRWTVYERKEEPNGVLVLGIHAASVAVLEGLKWRPFSGVGQAVFSLPGTKPGGGRSRKKRGGGGRTGGGHISMLSTISFIQANLQHSIAASGILTA